MADRKLTLDDIQQAQDASSALSVEELPVKPVAAPAAPADPNEPGFVGTVFRQDFVSPAVARIFASDGMDFNPDFALGKDVDEKEFDEITDGLSDEAKSNIASAAKSRSHLYFLADLARQSQNDDERLASYGGWGIAGRLGVDMLDPSNYLTGVGVLTKAERLKVAATAAKTASEMKDVVAGVEAAQRVSTMQKFAGYAARGGVEASVQQAIVDGGDPNRDGWDLLYGTAAALTVSGTLGHLFSGSEKRMLRNLHTQMKDKLGVIELEDAIGKARTNITNTLGDVNAVRAQLADAAGQTAQFLAAREGDVSQYSAMRHALESSGDPNAEAKTSNAVGIDQFIPSTWLGLIKQLKPKWAEGLDDGALLALRRDPAKSAEMVAALDAQNTAALRKAGAPVNVFNLYAAHHFGPGKGVRFAKASGDVLMDDILSGAQLSANEYLKGKTKNQALQIWADRARKGGVDLGGMLDRIPTTGAEAERAARLAAFDGDGAKQRLAELDQQLKAHTDEHARLTKESEGLLSQGEARKLQREVDSLQSELNGHKGKTSAKLAAKVTELEERIAHLTGAERETRLSRLHAEDEAKLGKDVAGNKQRTKLRESVVDRDIARERKPLDAALKTAKDAHGAHLRAAKDTLSALQPKLAGHTKASSARALLRALQGDSGHAARTAEADALRKALGLHAADEAAQAADGAARGELKGLHKALADKDASVKKLDALDTVKSANDLRGQQLEERGVASGMSKESLSAAKVVGFDEGLFPHLAEHASNGPVAKMKFGGLLNLFNRGTFAGVLRGSDNPVVRDEFGVLIGNSLGNADGSAVRAGASEEGQALQRTMVGKFHAAVTPAYDAWMKENGIWRGKQWDRKIRSQFMSEIGLHIRGQESESAAVKAAAERIRGIFAEFAALARDAGVKGFENVNENGTYLPRVFNFHEFHRLQNQVGVDGLEKLVGAAIAAANDIDGELAGKIAKAYVRRMRELRVGSDAHLMQGMSWDDVGFLRQFLGDAKMSSDEIEEIVAKFAEAKRPKGADSKPLLRETKKLKQKRRILAERSKTRTSLGKASPKADKRIAEIDARLAEIKAELAAAAEQGNSVMNKEGNFRHAKRRTQFDENFSMNLLKAGRINGDDPENVLKVTVSDLFENNVEALFGRYSRTMSGHIGLAKVGIKSAKDFGDRLKRVEHALENDPDQLKQVKKYAQAAYDILTARPLEDASMWSELMRTGRDLAYATQMENAGMANVPDLASLLAAGNLRYTAKAFFNGDVFGAMWNRGADGRMTDELMREIEETTGIGTDYLNNAIHSSYDLGEEYAEELVDGKWVPRKISQGFGKVSHAARVTGRAVTAGSGMAAVNSLGQRLAARNILYRLKDELFKGGRISKARLHGLGIDEGIGKRIEAQMRKHTSWTKGEMGGDIQRINFDQWEDLDARDALLYAVHREARKNIQEEDLGDTFLFQHKGIGKVLTQFRRFGITAFTKQTLRGIAEHDAETVTRVAMQSALAAGVYMAKQQLVLAGMEAGGADQDRIQKFKEANMGWGRAAAAAVRNSGWAALMPDMYDSTIGYAFGSPIFDVRNSGNSTRGLASIPMASLMSNLGGAASSTWQALVRNDRQFDKSDLRAWQGLIPFGNHLLVAPLFEALGAHLPDKDTDPDKNGFEFGFN